MRKSTTEEFIMKSKLVHGTLYDYSETIYVDTMTNVSVICRKHGKFWQSPRSHIRGSGCGKCNGGSLRNTIEFLRMAKAVHKDVYDYSQVNYINSNTKVKILCKALGHGIFLQTPNHHLGKRGCPKCFGTKLYTTEEYIQKANGIHLGKYDYSEVEYAGAFKKIKIICKEHGAFFQKPNGHLNNQGCPKCAGTFPLNNDEFKIRTIKVHGGRYDYSKVEYVNYTTPVVIICKVHGEFKQRPANHLNAKQGCSKCSGGVPHDLDIFVNRAKEIHGYKYDYSNVVYRGSHKKVEIICPKHGAFQQTPNVHVRKHGCPTCVHTVSKPQIRWLDYINVPIEFRNVSITIDGRLFKPDAMDKDGMIIWEFYGDFWHGNPLKYSPDKINVFSKVTFGELYLRTMEKQSFLERKGYNVLHIWESDFLKIENNVA